MTIRSDTRTRIKAIMLDAIGSAKVFDMAEVDRKVDGWTDDFMATDPLRLAELAEARPNSQVVVVDTVTNTWMRNPADVWNAGYRKVVVQ